MDGASDGVAGEPDARSGRRAASKAGARVRTKVAVRWWLSRYRIIPSRTTGHGVDGQTAATTSMIAAPDRVAATRSRVAECGVEGLGAPDRAFVDVGRMPGQAAGDVSVGPRTVHDDRGGRPQAADLARHGLALSLRGAVGRGNRPHPAVGGGHHDQIGSGRIGRPDRPRSPGGALGVLARCERVVHAHVDERAGCLDEGDQAPSVALRQDVEGREPVPGMRVTDQHDRGVGAGIAVDTIGGLRSFEPSEASVIGETLAIRPCVAERRLDIARQPSVPWEPLRRDLPPLDHGRSAPGGDECRGGGRRQRRLHERTSSRLSPGGAARGRARSGRGFRCCFGDRRLAIPSDGWNRPPRRSRSPALRPSRSWSPSLESRHRCRRWQRWRSPRA